VAGETGGMNSLPTVLFVAGAVAFFLSVSREHRTLGIHSSDFIPNSYPHF
jgi:hypothetical protein